MATCCAAGCIRNKAKTQDDQGKRTEECLEVFLSLFSVPEFFSLVPKRSLALLGWRQHAGPPG
jgi:hypothetical protein